MAQHVVGEMEMHSVANLATLQTPLAIFFLQKRVQTLFSLWESPSTATRARCLAFTARAHTSLSLSLSLSLCVCSVSIQRAAAGREEQCFNSAKHRYYFACFSNFTWCKYSRNHSTAIVIILCVFDFIKRGLYHQDFCEDYILEGRAGYLVNGSRFNHYFILIPSSDNRNSKIYKIKKVLLRI